MCVWGCVCVCVCACVHTCAHAMAQGCVVPGHLVPTSLEQRLEDEEVQFPPSSENA